MGTGRELKAYLDVAAQVATLTSPILTVSLVWNSKPWWLPMACIAASLSPLGYFGARRGLPKVASLLRAASRWATKMEPEEPAPTPAKPPRPLTLWEYLWIIVGAALATTPAVVWGISDYVEHRYPPTDRPFVDSVLVLGPERSRRFVGGSCPSGYQQGECTVLPPMDWCSAAWVHPGTNDCSCRISWDSLPPKTHTFKFWGRCYYRYSFAPAAPP
jgi:hypothetical protein